MLYRITIVSCGTCWASSLACTTTLDAVPHHCCVRRHSCTSPVICWSAELLLLGSSAARLPLALLLHPTLRASAQLVRTDFPLPTPSRCGKIAQPYLDCKTTQQQSSGSISRRRCHETPNELIVQLMLEQNHLDLIAFNFQRFKLFYFFTSSTGLCQGQNKDCTMLFIFTWWQLCSEIWAPTMIFGNRAPVHRGAGSDPE